MKKPELKNSREYNSARSWLSVFQNAIDDFDKNNSDFQQRHFKTRKIKLGSLKYRVRKLEEEVSEYEQCYPLSARFSRFYLICLARLRLCSLNTFHEERILRAARSQESRKTS